MKWASKSHVSQEERRKEILHDICGISIDGRFYNNFVIGGEIMNDVCHTYANGKRLSYRVNKGLIAMKMVVAKLVMSIKDPTLDICYHIKHGNIIIDVADQVNCWCWDFDHWDLNSAVKTLNTESVKLTYLDTEIDLSLFSRNEQLIIGKYIEKRIRQMELEKEIKKEQEKGQRRKDLVNMFCSE